VIAMLDFPTPPATAYGARAFTVEEIDAHPDRDRIWATIMAMRGEAEDAKAEAYDAGHTDGMELGAK
jgi:hypothetical protein